MIGRIGVIARGAYREAVRSRLFLNLLVIYALLLLGGQVVDAANVGEDGRVFHDIAHAALSLSGSMVALFVAIHLLATDIERRTLHIVLARPVTRLEVVLGKYLGLLGVLAVNTVAALALYLLFSLAGPHSAPTFARLLSIAFLFLEFCVVGAVAMMFSALSGTTTAVVYSLLLFVIGRLGGSLGELAVRKQDLLSGYREIAVWLQRVLPDLSRFDLNPSVALPAPSVLLLTALYAAAWSAALLLLGGVALGQRDLK